MRGSARSVRAPQRDPHDVVVGGAPRYAAGDAWRDRIARTRGLSAADCEHDAQLLAEERGEEVRGGGLVADEAPPGRGETPVCPAKAISASVTKSPPSERSWYARTRAAARSSASAAKSALDAPRVVDVRRLVPGLAEHLREDRAAEARLARRRGRRGGGRFRPRSVRSCGVHVRRTSSQGAKAETMSDRGERTAFGRPSLLPRRAHRHRVLADRDADAEPGQSSRATACTVSKSAASSPGEPAAAIQLAESLTRPERSIGAAARLVSASPTAMRPEAGASITAIGVALADGERLAGVAVEGERVSSRSRRRAPATDRPSGRGSERPPTVRSPIVIRKVLSATVGWSSTRRTASARSMPSAENGRRSGRARFTSRVIRGGLPRRAGGPCRPACCGRAGPAPRGAGRRWRAPTHGERAALALAERAEQVEAVRGDREDVALLRLVGPDLARGHARLLVRHRPQVDARAAAGAVRELGQRIREAARPDVVDREDGIVGSERPAAVDDLLGPALDLGVSTLDGVEVEVGGVRAGGHRGRGAATHADEHPRTADLDEERARSELGLVRVPGAHVAHPSREHDRLVVAAHDAGHLLLVRAEVAGEVRPAELVVEGGGADRALDHDGEGRGDPVGPRLGPLPRALAAGDAEARDGEADEAGLGLGARPVAPSSRISPPEPVAAPGKGEIAVG